LHNNEKGSYCTIVKKIKVASLRVVSFHTEQTIQVIFSEKSQHNFMQKHSVIQLLKRNAMANHTTVNGWEATNLGYVITEKHLGRYNIV